MANNSNRNQGKTNQVNASTRPTADSLTKGQSDPLVRDTSPLSIEGIRSGALSHVSIKLVMFLLILIFAVGFMITSFNPTQGLGGGRPDPQQRLQSRDAVATVGNDSIQRGQFEQIAARQDQMMEQFGQKVGPLEYLGSRLRTLQQLADNAATVQAARDAGLMVTDAEIEAEIHKRIDEQIKSEKQQMGEANFRRQIEAQHGSMQAYEDQLHKMADEERDNLERALLVQKLEKKIKDENEVTEDDYKRSQTKLKLRQIVIKPQPSGFNDKAAQEKNKAAAKAEAEKLIASLKSKPTPQNFATIAKKESDDLITKSTGGELGWKLPAELPVGPNVRDALVKSSGQLVGPIGDDSSGDQYIFLVEGRALRLPKDYAKNKAKLIKDYETQRDDEVWQKRQTEISKAATVEVLDPALQAFKIQSEQIFSASADEQEKLRREALQKYEQALPSALPTEAAAIRYQMAQLYRDLKEPKKAVEVLKAATDEVKDAPQLQLEYARALRDAGDKKTALAELQETSKALDTAPPSPPSMFGGNPDDALRFQLSSEFEALGRKDLAAKERAKVKPQGAPGMGGMGMPGMSFGR